MTAIISNDAWIAQEEKRVNTFVSSVTFRNYLRSIASDKKESITIHQPASDHPLYDLSIDSVADRPYPSRNLDIILILRSLGFKTSIAHNAIVLDWGSATKSFALELKNISD